MHGGVTTFEKEAEEYFRENAYNFDEVTACRECMEFGYNKAFVEADKNLKAIVTDFNKADEWHSYTERPKERLNALCFDFAQNQFILGYYDIESDEWIKYGGYETITMDMWKKIVPPKESE